jgi:putative transcriptional regulator
MSFGGHLRTLRGEAGLSRAELARRAGVPVSTLRHWENDRGFPGASAVFRLADALGVPVERLAEGWMIRRGKTRKPVKRSRDGGRHEENPSRAGGDKSIARSKLGPRHM